MQRAARTASANLFLAIHTNVIHEVWKNGVKRLLFLGSSCIYPRDCPQPIKEEYLLTGPPEETNKAYAIAKIAGIEMCTSYNKQYGTQFLCAMPTNLYGPGDNYDLETSHVLPALTRKFHEAKMAGKKAVEVWRTGKPRREFLMSDDLAEACLMLLEKEWAGVARIFPNVRLPLKNIGCGEDVTIKELTELVARTVGFKGKVSWDHSKPDGTPRKLLDVSHINALGWKQKIRLDRDVEATYRHFLEVTKQHPALAAKLS